LKRIVFFMLICVGSLVLLQGNAFTSLYNNPSALNFQTASEEVRSESELVKINIKYPIIRGTSNKKVESRLNEKFKNDAFNFKDEIEKQASENYEISKKQGFPFRTFEAMQDFKVTFNKNNILSIPITIDSYTGGAHGTTIIQPNNIDLLNGKWLSLKDLFKGGTDYKNIVIKEITEEINKTPEYYFPNALETVQKLDDSQPFYLTEDSIVIYYGHYDIAPYASGIREFVIPFVEFKGGVKDRFVD
jgi:hypothetical protein